MKCLYVGDAIHQSPFNGVFYPSKPAKEDNTGIHFMHQPSTRPPSDLVALSLSTPPSSSPPVNRHSATAPSSLLPICKRRLPSSACALAPPRPLFQDLHFRQTLVCPYQEHKLARPPLSIPLHLHAFSLFASTTPSLEHVRLESNREGGRGADGHLLVFLTGGWRAVERRCGEAVLVSRGRGRG